MSTPRTWLGAILAGAAGMALGFVVGRTEVPPPATPTRATVSATPAMPTAVEASATPATPAPSALPVPRQVDPLRSAREGDLLALKALDAKAAGARSIDEALALEEGHAALARREARRLAEDLASDSSLYDDPTTVAHAYRLALDAGVAPALLGDLARQDHPVVADLLFDLAVRSDPGSRLVLLAEDLLSGAARTHASKSLDAILVLRASRSCERTRALLPQVEERADDRALPLLDGLEARTGCGPKRADDCHPCLRSAEAAGKLGAAREAARGRHFIAPWSPEARDGKRAPR